MKKRTTIYYILAVLATAACRQDDFVIDCIPAQQLINVSVNAGMGTDDPDTKVDLAGEKGLSLTWNANDKIGVFAGPANFNRCFTIESETGHDYATFSGSMLPTGGVQQLFAYYPYDSGLEDPELWHLDYDGQVYNGDFSEFGAGTDITKYMYMSAVSSNSNGFEITTGSGWPSGYQLHFNWNLSSIVRFKISSKMTKSFSIEKIELYSPDQTFTDMYVNLSTRVYSWYWSDLIGVSLSTPLTMEAGKPEAVKYVHMASSMSAFDNTDLQVQITGTLDGKRTRMIIPKTAPSSASFAFGKRTTINVVLDDDATCNLANTVGIVQNGTKAVSPEFTKNNSDWLPDQILWGDGISEKYASGIIHKYSSDSEHTASFSCWGTSNAVKFNSLENITSIDFSNF